MMEDIMVGAAMDMVRDGRRTVAGGFREAMALSTSPAAFLWTSEQHHTDGLGTCIFYIVSIARESLTFSRRLSPAPA